MQGLQMHSRLGMMEQVIDFLHVKCLVSHSGVGVVGDGWVDRRRGRELEECECEWNAWLAQADRRRHRGMTRCPPWIGRLDISTGRLVGK